MVINSISNINKKNSRPHTQVILILHNITNMNVKHEYKNINIIYLKIFIKVKVYLDLNNSLRYVNRK